MDKFEIIRDPNDYFGQLEWNDKLAIAASRELFTSSTSIEERRLRLKKTVYCFIHPDYIHQYSLKILANKNFVLVKELNRFIQKVSENGCIVKWLKRYRFASEKQPIYEYATATAQSFVSPLAIGLCLFLLASSAIIAEWFIYRMTRTPNSSKFWQFVQMLIDPDRYFLLDNVDWTV